MITNALYYDFAFGAVPDMVTARLLETRIHNGSPALILDQTIFYPEGGGQPADRGTINGVRIVDVIEENGEILHLMENAGQSAEALALDTNASSCFEIAPAGSEVKLELDMERRRDLTVQHSAQHLLSGTVLRLTGFSTVSMHLGDEYNTIDINGATLDSAATLRIEDEVIAAIEENRPYIIHLCPPEKVEDFPLRKVPPQGEAEIRVVEIGTIPHREDSARNFALDFSPCCGTHVSSTGQIGAFRILGTEKYKGMIRMTFIAGRRCLAEGRMLRNNIVRISQLLSVPVEETGAAVSALREKTAALEEQVKRYEEEAARRVAETLVARDCRVDNSANNGAGSNAPDFVVESFSDKSMEAILRIGKQAQKISGAVIALGSEKDLKFAAVCAAKGIDLRPYFKREVEAAEGSGGGGPTFFQGQFDSPDKYRRFFAELEKTRSAAAGFAPRSLPDTKP
jgi:alanyl-tRNA synthetase